MHTWFGFSDFAGEVEAVAESVWLIAYPRGVTDSQHHAGSLHGRMIIDDPATGDRYVAMTTAEAAQFLGISVSSLRKRARVGDIPVHRTLGAARYFFFRHRT